MNEVAEAPVSDDKRASVVEQDIVRLEVPVNEPKAVCIVQSIGQRRAAPGDGPPVTAKTISGNVSPDAVRKEGHHVEPFASWKVLPRACHNVRMVHALKCQD